MMTILRERHFGRLPEREAHRFKPLPMWKVVLIALPFALLFWALAVAIFLLDGSK